MPRKHPEGIKHDFDVTCSNLDGSNKRVEREVTFTEDGLALRFDSIGKPEFATRIRSVLDRGNALKAKHNIVLNHRAIFSGENLVKVLAGHDVNCNHMLNRLEKGMDNLEDVLAQYGRFDKDITVNFYWSVYCKFSSLAGYRRVYLWAANDKSEIHHEFMHVFDCSSKESEPMLRDDHEVMEKRMRDFKTLILLANGQIGGGKIDFENADNYDFDFSQDLLEAAYRIKKGDIDGKEYIQKVGDRFVIKGVADLMTMYSLTEAMECKAVSWEQFNKFGEGKEKFANGPKQFLLRALKEAKVSPEPPHVTLLYQLALHVKRVCRMAPDAVIHGVKMKDLYDQIFADPGRVKNLEFLAGIFKKAFGITEGDMEGFKLKTDFETRELSEIRSALQESSLSCKGMGGTFGYAVGAWRENSEALRKSSQTRSDLMPDEYWRKYNQAEVRKLESRVQSINQKYGVKVNIQYMGNMKEVMTNSGRDVQLKVHGNIDDMNRALSRVDRCLGYYGNGSHRLFDGMEVSVAWFDSWEMPFAGKASRRGILVKSDTDEYVIHHELGHMIDMLEGSHWEKSWLDYREVMGQNSKVMLSDTKKLESFEGLLIDNAALNIESLDEGDFRMQGTPSEEERESVNSNRILGVKIEYEVDGKEKLMDSKDYWDKDGKMKGVVSEYSLKNSKEDRAEIWEAFTAGEGFAGRIMSLADPILSAKFYCMAKGLMEANRTRIYMSESWFASKGISVSKLGRKLGVG